MQFVEIDENVIRRNGMFSESNADNITIILAINNL